MIWNTHFVKEGRHAFLSPSKYSWINYDDEKLDRVFAMSMAAQRGTELHDLAHQLIRLGVKLPRTSKTLNLYVNDAIGFRMKPEQILYFSDNCFGTCDAISYRNNSLRIHDLKTGVTPASFDQLNVYAALFCLEYRTNPFETEVILRIYQNDAFEEIEGDGDTIMRVMEKIKAFDKRITAMRLEAEM